jgi:two-component system LytT family response regulator
MIHALLIDDERNALDALQDALMEYEYIQLIGRFTNPYEALEQAVQLNYQLVFLDIEMPGINGLEVAEKLLEMNANTHIVFITAYDRYAVDAFEVNALDYLLKPVRHERLGKTMDKILARLQQDEQPILGNVGRITCFGTFQLRINSEQKTMLKWRTNKVRELLAYLVHHRIEGVHKARIMDDLWPDMEQERSAAYLHTCIYQIRKIIKQYGLEQQMSLHYANDSYQLILIDVNCDVDEFLQMSGDREEINSETINGYVQAIELYRDHYLEDNDYAWSIALKQKLYVHYMDMVSRMVDYYNERNEVSQAIILLKQFLTNNSLQEQFHVMLMKAYDRNGDRVALQEHYYSVKKLFLEELGVELQASTSELYHQLTS